MSVYFIYECPFHDDNLDCLDLVTEFKIGESKNPKQRCRNLQTGNLRKLKIYRTIICNSKKDAQLLEDTIHERFAAQRIRGEWFSITRLEIDQICEEVNILQQPKPIPKRNLFIPMPFIPVIEKIEV